MKREELGSGTFASKDGKNWEPAKQVPYYPSWLENLKCAFGFHELVNSSKYEGVHVCFRCGKRRIVKYLAH